MPYCRKCGTELDQTASFCHVCGTPVAVVVPVVKQSAPERRPVRILSATTLILVLVPATVIGSLLVLPVSPVQFNQIERVPDTGMDHLFLDLQVDFAQVNIVFKGLSGNMAILNVTANGSVGVFEDPNQAVNVIFSCQATNNSIFVNASVSQLDRWFVFNDLNVKCDVYLDPSADLTLYVRSGVGSITMDADSEVKLQRVDLKTETGNIDVSLSKGAVAAGSFSLKTTTGLVQFKMDEADVSRNVSVSLQSITDAVNVDLTATQMLSGNVTVNARTTTGNVCLDMEIDSAVGTRIESATELGRITVDTNRFLGEESSIQSKNYPAGNNFLVALRSETGDIIINAAYGYSIVLN